MAEPQRQASRSRRVGLYTPFYDVQRSRLLADRPRMSAVTGTPNLRDQRRDSAGQRKHRRGRSFGVRPIMGVAHASGGVRFSARRGCAPRPLSVAAAARSMVARVCRDRRGKRCGRRARCRVKALLGAAIVRAAIDRLIAANNPARLVDGPEMRNVCHGASQFRHYACNVGCHAPPTAEPARHLDQPSVKSLSFARGVCRAG